MIQYLRHKEIDKAKWDACITNSVNGILYAYSWYLDLVSPGWEALVEDDYKSVMPLTVRKKYGVYYTFCPPYTQQLGLFSTVAITEKEVISFLLQIPSKYKYIEMNLNEQNFIKTDLFKTTTRITYLLKLAQPYKDIRAGYSIQTKRNLKKAQEASLTIKKDAPPEKIIELFRANNGKMYSHTPSQFTILSKLMHGSINKGIGQSWGVYSKENELLAGAFFLTSHKRIVFLFSGANLKAYQSHAVTFLFNQYLQENAGRDFIFDFEGGLEPNLGRFYRGFGSTETPYWQIRKITLPPYLRLLKKLKDKIKGSST